MGTAFSSTAKQNQPEPENAFDQPASSSASTFANNVPCDIFINHRGSDVKYTLATTICHTLQCIGLRIFLDVETLQPGDVIDAEIRQAMTSASLHIAIFTKNYAQSSWCLNELSFMLKTGTKIIPIFYYVQPSDIRLIVQGKGIYADAFSQHKKKRRYPSEKLEEWKRALHDISLHSGYVVNNNEDEGRLLKNIVNDVLRVMKKVPLEVADHPVGLDELVQDFEEATLQSFHTHHNAKIVGIVGMGGRGKTTLSKELFNKKFPSFDRCSFVSDVRDAADKKNLHNKQKKLLEDLGVDHSSVHDVEDGRRILSNCLRSLRALIVLDDVDHKDQLQSLLPNINSLASGSLVIVTTRELEVLVSWNVSSIYKMPGLNDLYAKQLFCWHAFLQPSPLCGFDSLVEEFVSVCSGLPLSLKVFGGQLYGQKSKQYWESTLHRIKRILPADIIQRLQVSYDALHEEDKEIFLDVACFFNGEEKSLAIAVWDGCGWSGLYSWETLLNKCLVEVDNNNCIKMHDQLRDMGREIATARTPHRFWTSEQILNIPTHSQERTEIRGMAGSAFRAPREIVGNSGREFKCLRSVCGLKFLFVGEHEFSEEIASLSEQLVWLRWYSFQDRNLPSWLSLRNLRVLELYGARYLEELWDERVELPLQLRVLRIISSGWRLRRIPSSIGRLKHLKRIILRNGFCGSSLPEEFCGLRSLEHLELRGSEMLSSLPAGFGELISLRHIDLNSAQLRILPDSFKKLVNLEYLNLSGCRNLSFRLDMLENITKLEFLDLSFCNKLEELPNEIINQASLKELKLDGCFQLRDLPTHIGQLCKLKTLRIQSPLLTSLPCSLGNLSSLTSLDIETPLLTNLPCSLGNSSSLTSLEKLERWEDSMERLNLFLRELSIEYSGVRELPFGAGSSSAVSEISVRQVCCPAAETPSFVANAHLMEIDTLPTSLNSVKLRQCKMLKDIKGVGGLVNLQDLSINDCPELNELPSFTNLASLKTFEIRDCPKVEKIEGLEHCRSLTKLKVYTCWKVPGIQSLRNLESLERLDLTCDTISALKPCVQSMKECPRALCEMSISGRVVHFEKRIVESFEFPDLTVMRWENGSEWYKFNEESKRNEEIDNGESETVKIFVSFDKGSGDRSLGSVAFLVQKAMSVRVGRGRVWEAFYQLLALLE